MSKTSLALGLLLVSLSAVGCARPGEIGWTPAYSTGERFGQIARNWDLEGKQTQDDIDHILLLRPVSQLTEWNMR
ncbi:MAG TPA: hypothetical protein VF624_14640 [Tepidisphaeraceae bacterium]|jgi:hypothetical protein